MTADVINFLIKRGTTFTIAADKDTSAMEAIRKIDNRRLFKTEDGIATDREIGETVHTMNRTNEAFRLIVLRWSRQQRGLFDPEPYCYHTIASSLQSAAEEVVWEYNGRGQMENIIKELKNGAGMESLPCGNLVPRIPGTAYLVHQRLGMVSPELSNSDLFNPIF